MAASTSIRIENICRPIDALRVLDCPSLVFCVAISWELHCALGWF